MTDTTNTNTNTAHAAALAMRNAAAPWRQRGGEMDRVLATCRARPGMQSVIEGLKP